ncbi:MAG TPA: hypothetical protein PJ982_19220, partial [Lacipirellulaceae bacterium]|nr:hypothetical protein [Lacipirellulaceae bacterium]
MQRLACAYLAAAMWWGAMPPATAQEFVGDDPAVAAPAAAPGQQFGQAAQANAATVPWGVIVQAIAYAALVFFWAATGDW